MYHVIKILMKKTVNVCVRENERYFMPWMYAICFPIGRGCAFKDVLIKDNVGHK